jgi:hypothetical protein
MDIFSAAESYVPWDRMSATPSFHADIEDLNDAFFIRGDARKVRAVENGVLQCPRLQENLLAPHFGDDLSRARTIAFGSFLQRHPQGGFPHLAFLIFQLGYSFVVGSSHYVSLNLTGLGK